MKFIHTADWHLGKLFYGGYLTEEQEWILKEQFIPLVDEEKPDVILLAGDVYDRSVPPAEAVDLFNEIVYEICDKRKIPMIVISGNHDSAERLSFARLSLLYLLPVAGRQGLYICGELGITTSPIVLKDTWGDVIFVPLPYAEPSVIRHYLQCDAIRDHDSAERALSESILATLPQHSRKIAIAHEYVAGGLASDSERPLDIGGTEQIQADIFKDYNYTALGHLHAPQKAGSDVIRYSGSLLKYSFSEVKQKKGIIVGEINGEGQVTTRFIPLKPRHNVRIITGTFAELMQQEDLYNDDFIRADLMDENPVIDAMARLRTRYPHIMALTSRRLTKEDSGERHLDLHKKVSELDMIEIFMEEFRNRKLNDEEKKYIQHILEEIKEEATQ